MADYNTRLTNVENTLNALIKSLNLQKMYSEADTNGIRQSVSNITPYAESKTAYIGDTIITFNCSINGNLSVYVIDNDGNVPTHSIKRSADFIQVVFDEPLESVANVTISIN